MTFQAQYTSTVVVNMTPYFSFSRTSYLPNEIILGHRFKQMQIYLKDHNKFEINFSAFHSTDVVESARGLGQMEKPTETKLQKVQLSDLVP